MRGLVLLSASLWLLPAPVFAACVAMALELPDEYSSGSAPASLLTWRVARFAKTEA